MRYLFWDILFELEKYSKPTRANVVIATLIAKIGFIDWVSVKIVKKPVKWSTKLIIINVNNIKIGVAAIQAATEAQLASSPKQLK